MTIDQPKATIIAAGIMAVGQLIVALIKRPASDKPKMASDKPPAVKRRWWIFSPIAVLLFSVFMIVWSFIDIVPYLNPKVAATSAMVISVFINGCSIFIFFIIAGWNAITIWQEMRKK